MIGREENTPLEPQSPAEDPCESGSRDGQSLLEIEKKRGHRVYGWGLSPQQRAKGARQVYELRGGTKRTDISREESRYRKYGLTGEDVALLLLAQAGACVGCGVVFSSEINFVIDHCHKTQKVRGLLCRECNIVLAHWMTPGKLRKLAKYLEDNE